MNKHEIQLEYFYRDVIMCKLPQLQQNKLYLKYFTPVSSEIYDHKMKI